MPSKKSLSYNVIGRRITAALIDFILWVILYVVAAKYFGTITHDTSNGSNMYYANLTGAPEAFFFLAALAYYSILEWRLGATLGKLATGICVMNERGKKITFYEALIRNLFRIIDGFPYIVPYLVGLIVIAGNDKKQRIGDKVAHTVVIRSS